MSYSFQCKVNDLIFGGSNQCFMASCANDGSVRLWNTDSYEQTLQFLVLQQVCSMQIIVFIYLYYLSFKEKLFNILDLIDAACVIFDFLNSVKALLTPGGLLISWSPRLDGGLLGKGAYYQLKVKIVYKLSLHSLCIASIEKSVPAILKIHSHLSIIMPASSCYSSGLVILEYLRSKLLPVGFLRKN